MANDTDDPGITDKLPEISPSEGKVLRFLSELSMDSFPVPEGDISATGMDDREISSSVSWLEKKGLVSVKKSEHVSYILTKEGERFLKEGLPEERAFRIIRQNGKIPTQSLMSELGQKDGKIALAQLARLGIKPSGGMLQSGENAEAQKAFKERKAFLESIGKGTVTDRKLLDHFRKREDVIQEKKRSYRLLDLTDLGRYANLEVSSENAISELTPEMLQNGTWHGKTFRRYDLNAPVERTYAAALHPLTYLAEKVRRIFLDLGFTEMDGHYMEYAGWNMDALFIPQDHPAREMQDTFYVDSETTPEFENPEVLKILKNTHEKGIEGYSGWGYNWDVEKAYQLVLRTHTTVSTIRYLYHHRHSPQAAFSVEKVFRHESVDWKHLAELHQIEGTYYGKDANLSTLKWLIKEFYSRLGFKNLKFVPSYYPYTEPSLDVVATINGKEVEMGGSGVFRPEVTRPLGLKGPVVAWGLGLERLAMIYYNLNDIREIYQSDIDWLRTFSMKY